MQVIQSFSNKDDRYHKKGLDLRAPLKRLTNCTLPFW